MECAKTTKGQLWNRTKHAQLYPRDSSFFLQLGEGECAIARHIVPAEEDFVALVAQRVF